MLDKVKTIVADSLQNLLTGMGVVGMDKSMSSTFVDIDLTDRELEDAYAADWLVGKVCDLPPFDMTREWRTFTGDMSAEDLEKLVKLEHTIQLRSKVKEAMTWARVYGGAGIILNVDDGNEPWEPLEIDKIKQGSLKHLIVADKQFLHMGEINNDPLSPNYGYPNTYRLAPTSVQIHHTRVVRFEGVPLPLQSRRRNKMWGKSLIERLYTALRHAAEVQENVGALIHEATVDVIKIPELMEMLSNAETEAQMKNRFGIAKMQKSVNRMLLLDAEEEYEQHSQTFTGLTEITEKFLSIVAGAADIPITRLFGQSPAGMNSTGDSDIRNYYDHLSAKQETDLRPKLEYIDKIMHRHLFGHEIKDDHLTFEFNSLWQMTDEETANLQELRARRDQQYLDMNIIDESIIARDLMEKDTYSGVDAEYVKELEDIVDEADGKGEERLDGGSFGAQLGENGEPVGESDGEEAGQQAGQETPNQASEDGTAPNQENEET